MYGMKIFKYEVGNPRSPFPVLKFKYNN